MLSGLAALRSGPKEELWSDSVGVLPLSLSELSDGVLPCLARGGLAGATGDEVEGAGEEVSLFRMGREESKP